MLFWETANPAVASFSLKLFSLYMLRFLLIRICFYNAIFIVVDLEIAYDRVDREVWNVYKVYGVGGKLMGMKAFYRYFSTKVNKELSENFLQRYQRIFWSEWKSEWKLQNAGRNVKLESVVSRWLFSMFLDGVVRKIKAML